MTIEAGARVDAVTEVVTAAMDVLGDPLDDEALEHGWTDELREDVLAAVADLRDALTADPSGTRVAEEWPGIDAVDPTADDERLGRLLDVEFCLADLERAEHVLASTHRAVGDLSRPVSDDDRASGFDEAVRASLHASASSVASRLADGGYLTEDDVDGWFSTLAGHGVVRRAPTAFLERAGVGAVISTGDVEEFPKGARWREAVLYDGDLVDVVRTDLEAYLERAASKG